MNLNEKLSHRIQALIVKGESVLATSHMSVDGRTSYVSYPELSAWRAQAVSSLESVLGKEHTYTTMFKRHIGTDSESARAAILILKNVHEDLQNGYLVEITNLISAEVFGDLLEMALHLFDSDYHTPAASLSGAVLEDGLRRICRNHDLTVNPKDDLNSLNQKCVQGNIYNNLVRQQVQTWITLRNHADHGNFEEYKPPQIADMIRGVQSFLAEYLK